MWPTRGCELSEAMKKKEIRKLLLDLAEAVDDNIHETPPGPPRGEGEYRHVSATNRAIYAVSSAIRTVAEELKDN